MEISEKTELEIVYLISPKVENEELTALSDAAWRNHESFDEKPAPTDFRPILNRSLGFICAYHSNRLIGFVNLAWDGGVHAFVLDTMVHPEFQRRGIGKRLVKEAVEIARTRGVEWVHVDFEPHLQGFYNDCGFKDTRAGLINLKRENDD